MAQCMFVTARFDGVAVIRIAVIDIYILGNDAFVILLNFL